MDTPIIRSKDKISFCLGIFLLVVMEYVVVACPQQFPLVYTALLIPLLIYRFLDYHKSNYHYFMLDFCYYVQVWCLVSSFVLPHHNRVFKVFFGLGNGPLLSAIIMWKNKMVFHDLDKITSLFIHVAPPLVSYCLRWFPNVDHNYAFDDLEHSYISIYDIFCMVVFYSLWQFLYLFKTEYIDHKKFQEDETLMTSARWFTTVQPHPIYNALRKRGIKASPITILVGVQLIFTIFMLIPVIWIYQYQWVHASVILFAFACATWNGASYYFEVFTENYQKRIAGKIKKMENNGQEEKEKEPEKRQYKYLPNSVKSVIIFVLYFGFGLLSLLVLMKLLIL
eukprot:TRINITY_DN1205_c0_g1_i1.p1 TRINITY_DN1205_c0_g1~~TRINITY_DN1205_c0_g1_i1.p1  ORF type:complete len:337 (+),score=41.97 TRINITY_DN1205_c0_g1_i1:409-1419(+)